MPVVADVDSDIRVLRLEYGISEVAWLEVEFFPETRSDMRDVILPVFPEVRPVGVNHRGGIVVHTGGFFFIDGNDDHHVVALRHFLHQLHRRAIWNFFYRVVPPGTLLGAEVRPGEDLLHADNLHALAPRLVEQLQVLLDIRFADFLQRLVGRARVGRLNQAGLHYTRHLRDSLEVSSLSQI